jgi:hypothetical protein
LEAPLEMRDFDINLKVGTGLYSTIQKDKIDEVSGALLSVGREDISCALLLGETVTVSFQKDSAVILALYGLCDGERSLERSLLSPWLVVDSKRMPRIGDDRNARLGYDPKPATAGTAPSTYPVVFRVSGRDECFIQQPDGSLRPAGWSYNIVREFVENLWEEELEYPLTFGRRIKAFRLNVENGRQLPTELFRVIVDTTKPVEHKWEAETIVSFRNEFAGEGAGTVFEFQPTSENFYRVMQLPNAVVRWEFKEDLPPAVPAMSAMQASLF